MKNYDYILQARFSGIDDCLQNDPIGCISE
jgi:hypothetical protein